MRFTIWGSYWDPFRKRDRINLYCTLSPEPNIGALINRVGFWGPLDYNYNKEPQKIIIGNYLNSYISAVAAPGLWLLGL